VTRASEKFRRGDFVTVNFTRLPDGKCIVKMKDRFGRRFKFIAMKLNEPDEEIIEDEEVEESIE